MVVGILPVRVTRTGEDYQQRRGQGVVRERRDGSATEILGSGGDSTTGPSVVGTNGVVQSVTKLLEAQTLMVAEAMVA